jgi:tRNA 5-methylaminomethyl-2-thiouridine biosynthesis bifunctional protein
VSGPGVPSGGLAGRRVAVVGAGVVGLSLAWAAAAAGAEVTLVEAGDAPGAGASGLPLALVNPYRGRSGRARAVDVAGAEALWRWVGALEAAGHSPGAHRTGVLRVASDARQARAFAAIGGVTPVPPGRLGPYRLPHGGFTSPLGGWVDPDRWLAALAGAAAAAGADLRWSCAAAAVERADGGWSLHTAAGERVAADLVALCIGAADPGALPALPVTAVRGEIVITPHPALPYPLAGAVYAGPLGSPARFSLAAGPPHIAVGGNHVILAADGRDPRATAPAPEQTAGELLASVRWVLPSVTDEVAALWSGVRARGPDPEPILSELRSGVWWVGAFSGRGFLRAAERAEALVARWVAG